MVLKTLDRRNVFKGKVIDLSVDTVIFPKQQVEMERINHPGGAAVVPLLSDESVILIKQYRYCIGDTIWEIPAGRLEPDENPLDCAKRELVEEVGFKATNVQKLTEIYSAPGYCNEVIYIFLATELVPDKQKLEDDEIIKVVKLPFAKAIEKVKTGEITDAKTVVGLLLAKELVL
ncbi:MAG: NUDIX hydrolase [Deltaproteobacteria bacterium]|nr:NUDIX hydrolase [Deltaproteobacteria bacterium]MCK5011913.1 NUDIX hydrolase [Deltaproteobacteria bacterium]MCK5186524.1 NUDIX hydrolase [Deltaproteobacteria bacterium]MCK5421203.1 NUDIX hydrolase [Deltaproteobacteria bacterium]NOQ86492.1 NUDIX domain-containing protein [Deltaproteobacteria bacterium]